MGGGSISSQLLSVEVYSALSRETGETGEVTPKKLFKHVVDYRPNDELGPTLDKILNEKQTDPDIGPYVTSVIDAIEEARQNPGNWKLVYVKQSLLNQSRFEIAQENKIGEIVEDALTQDEMGYKILNVTVQVTNIVGYE